MRGIAALAAISAHGAGGADGGGSGGALSGDRGDRLRRRPARAPPARRRAPRPLPGPRRGQAGAAGLRGRGRGDARATWPTARRSGRPAAASTPCSTSCTPWTGPTSPTATGEAAAGHRREPRVRPGWAGSSTWAGSSPPERATPRTSRRGGRSARSLLASGGADGGPAGRHRRGFGLGELRDDPAPVRRLAGAADAGPRLERRGPDRDRRPPALPRRLPGPAARGQPDLRRRRPGRAHLPRADGRLRRCGGPGPAAHGARAALRPAPDGPRRPGADPGGPPPRRPAAGVHGLRPRVRRGRPAGLVGAPPGGPTSYPEAVRRALPRTAPGPRPTAPREPELEQRAGRGGRRSRRRALGGDQRHRRRRGLVHGAGAVGDARCGGPAARRDRRAPDAPGAAGAGCAVGLVARRGGRARPVVAPARGDEAARAPPGSSCAPSRRGRTRADTSSA